MAVQAINFHNIRFLFEKTKRSSGKKAESLGIAWSNPSVGTINVSGKPVHAFVLKAAESLALSVSLNVIESHSRETVKVRMKHIEKTVFISYRRTDISRPYRCFSI